MARYVPKLYTKLTTVCTNGCVVEAYIAHDLWAANPWIPLALGHLRGAAEKLAKETLVQGPEPLTPTKRRRTGWFEMTARTSNVRVPFNTADQDHWSLVSDRAPLAALLCLIGVSFDGAQIQDPRILLSPYLRKLKLRIPLDQEYSRIVLFGDMPRGVVVGSKSDPGPVKEAFLLYDSKT